MSAGNVKCTSSLVLRRRHWREAGEYAEGLGWTGPVEGSGPGGMTWTWAVDEETTFRVARDEAAGEFYCRFHGPDGAALVELLDAAEERLDVWDKADLLGAPYEETDPRLLVQAIFRLAMGAPLVHSPEFMPPLLGAMAQEHPMVRAAAARATAYMQWPEFFPVLATMAESDPDERVRAEAAKVADAFRQVGLADA